MAITSTAPEQSQAATMAPERATSWAVRGATGALLVAAVGIPVVFSPQVHDLFALTKLVLAELLVAVLLACGALASLEGARLRLRTPVDRAVLALIAVNVVAALLGESPLESALGAYGRYQGVMTLGLYLLFFYAATLLLRRPRFMVRFLAAVSAGATIASLYGLMQHFGLDPLTWQTTTVRPPSTLGHPNLLAAELAMALPVTAGLAAVARGRWRLLPIAAATVQILALLFTASRSGWIGLAAGGVVFLLALRHLSFRSPGLGRTLASTVIGVLGLGLALAVLPAPRGAIVTLAARFASAITAGDVSAQARLQILRATGTMIRDYPVVGVGPEAFGLVFPRYRPREYARTEGINVTPTKAHSDLLQVAATTGLIGLGIYLWFLTSLFRTGLRLDPDAGPPERGDPAWRFVIFRASVAAALAAYLAQSLFGFAEISITWLFWALAGVFLATSPAMQLEEAADGDVPPETSSVRRLVPTGVATLVAAVLLFSAVAGYLADATYQRGETLVRLQRWDAALAAYRQAVTLAPLRREYHRRLGGAYEEMADRFETGKRPLLQAAQAEYQRSLSLYRRDAYTLIDWARVTFELAPPGDARRNDALAAANEAITIDPNSPVVETGAAVVYRMAGDLDRAAERSRIAIDLAPYPEAHLNLGQVYRAQGRYDLAFREFQSASLLVYSAPVLTELGVAYANLGQVREARDVFVRALGADPRFTPALLNAGRASALLGDQGAAEAYYRQALALDPENPLAREGLQQIPGKTEPSRP